MLSGKASARYGAAIMTTTPAPQPAADRDRLHIPLGDGAPRLVPLLAGHGPGLQAACAADADIWRIYPTDYGPDGFAASFGALLANPTRLPFAILDGDLLVGMTAYLRIEPAAQTLEIGNSYLRPDRRGTGLNGAMKRLMIDHAFACGFRRIEFRIDARNGRSQAAVGKLGAVREGLLRAERITWTGHVRDTVLFSLLESDPRPGR